MDMDFTMSESIIRLRPVRQWEAPKDPLKDWEKYGFYPEIEEDVPQGEPFYALLRAELSDKLPYCPFRRVIDGDEIYVDIPAGEEVEIYAGIMTEDMETDDGIYLICTYPKDSDLTDPLTGETTIVAGFHSKITARVYGGEKGLRIHQGQVFARMSIYHASIRSGSVLAVTGEEFLEFMTPKLSYE